MKRYLEPEKAYRDYVLSGKKHLIITGNKKSGKSTLFNGIKAIIGQSSGELESVGTPFSHVLLRDVKKNCSMSIGVYDQSRKTMMVCKDGFIEIGVPAIFNAIENEEKWFFIDEIGLLETGCDQYLEAVEKVFDSKQVLAVLRGQQSVLYDRIKKRPDVFWCELPGNPHEQYGMK